MSNEKSTLDYSSPAQERRRERCAEDERRAALEAYNKTTFGERRPLASAFLRIAVVIGVATGLVLLLPRPYGRLAASGLIILAVVWEWRQTGWSTTGALSLRRTFWWW